MFNYEKRFTQVVIGSVFAFFIALTMLLSFITKYIETGLDVFGIREAWYFGIMGVFLAVSLITLLEYRWAVSLQTICMLAMSYVCFIYNGSSDFYAWGFLLLFILMGWYYEQFQKGFWIKTALFILSFVFVATVSSLIHDNEWILIGCLIYFCCVFFFLAFITRNLIKKMISNEERLVTLEETLMMKDEELKSIQIESSADEGMYDGKVSMSELQKKVSDLEEENSRLREEIKNNITTYSSRNNLIRLTQESVDEELRRFPELEGLRDVDYRILSSFFLSKGGKANREIAFELNTNEATIKNRLHVIMKKLNVPSRASLLVKILEFFGETSV